MEVLVSESRRVWIPDHPTAAYLPGRVEETGEDGLLVVVDEDGNTFKIPPDQAQSVDPAALRGVDDLLLLGDFNEAALLHNIRVRYSEDKIYTGIGSPILISVNPYQNLAGLYSTERQKEYRRGGGSKSHQSGLPVHLYSVADEAYKTILESGASQSIIISGESGAGKTEATKRMLAYLAEMQRSTFKSDGSSQRSIEQQVLDANPVLEAFGNAKTVRNDNSSRFGKFIEVEFDASGRLLSAQISNYLLEKCRIVTQQPGERNYHIFYQLCAGVLQGLSVPEGLGLADFADYEYTRVCGDIDGVDDAEGFAEVVDCMASLGFTQEERSAVLKIVAAVLHLGNLEFSRVERDDQDGVAISDEAAAEVICNLLGVTSQQLRSVLEQKTLEDPLTKKTIHMPQTVQSASHTRHSMAKVVYSRMFDWLVVRINESISGGGKATQKDLRRIGLLDIYGFEVFEWNSFEQLCINFANEKLQQHFNTHMFTLEQKMYSSEGISWSHITFQDNAHIIEALDKKPLGLFQLVDSECIMPNATDSTLVAKVHNTFKNSKIITKPGRFSSNDFAVAHYAGEVVYNVETFLEKNTDKLHADVVNLFRGSADAVVSKLFTDPRFTPDAQPKADASKAGDRRAQYAADRARRRSGAPEGAEGRARQNVTVSMMFREQLDKLVEDLNRTSPRYVRCIKPNGNKTAREFDSLDVLRQLRCAGMLESIRIRKAGYAVRRPVKEFFTRFRTLAPHLAASGADPDYRGLSQKLAAEVEARLAKEGINLGEKPWQMGTSRIFMKEELERHFERILVENAKAHIMMIQKRYRGYQQRRRYAALRAAALEAQAALRTCLAVASYVEEKRRRDAAVLLQAGLRGHVLREAFARQRCAAVTVQRFVRGWRCRSRIGKLRDKVAAERIRKMREAEEKAVELQRAKEEAKERELAMEAMQKEMEEEKRRLAAEAEVAQQRFAAEAETRAAEAAAERSKQEEERGQREEERRLQEENQRLQGELRRKAAREEAEAAAAKAAAAREGQNAQELEEQVKRLMREKEQAIREKEQLQDNLSKTVANHQSVQEEHVQMANQLMNMRLEQTYSAPIGGLDNTTALAKLRSEMLARFGGGTGPTATTVHPALHSALSEVPESLDGDGPPRKTLVNQREVFESLKQQFAEMQGQKPEEVPDVLDAEGPERIRGLEDEVRRLRRENAEMKTLGLSAQEEVLMKAQEAERFMQQVSRLQAELEDAQYQSSGNASEMKQQLELATTSLHQQTEDMAHLSARATQAASRAAALEEELQARDEQLALAEENVVKMTGRISALSKDKAEYERRVGAVGNELDSMRVQLSSGEQEAQHERDRLHEHLKAKDNEIANIKRVLDDVMSAHVPVEELKRWKARAESYEQQYTQAMRYNREVTSAVGHMTQGASRWGGDLSELQKGQAELLQDLERTKQEVKMTKLEKEDLQKELDTLQSSCSYFQNKYKATQGELRALQGSGGGSSGSSASEAKYLQQVAQLSQQLAESQGRRQAHSQRLALVRECLNTLLPVHAEQASLADRAGQHIGDTEVRRGLREKQAHLGASVAKLCTIMGDGGAVPGGPPAAASHQAFQPQQRPASSSQPQQQKPPPQQDALDQSSRQPRASLLTQLNVSQTFNKGFGPGMDSGLR